jgi:hypothetical protein
VPFQSPPIRQPKRVGGHVWGTKAKPLALLLAADGFALFGCQAVKRKRHLKQAKKALDFLLDAQQQHSTLEIVIA